ncbi:MAG: serine--tRNA ligase [Myxococcota bacterium]
MLDFREVAADLEAAKRRLARRPSFEVSTLDRVQSLVSNRSQVLTRTQELKTEKNTQGKTLSKVFKSGSDAEKAEARQAQKKLNEDIQAGEESVRRIEQDLEALMYTIPNYPDDSVPDGADETANVVVRQWGDKPRLAEPVRDHVSIGQDLWGQLDFEAAAQMTGARFAILMDDLARLERALGQFMLDLHTSEHGYREVSVPYLVNSASLTHTGQLPKFGEDLFRVPFSDATDYWLIPTAEVPLTNLHARAIVETDLPLGYCALTPCFRKEAGAAGRDTRGLMRQHQFHKVELVRFAHPEGSYDELELMVRHAAKVLERLELHHQVTLLCAGDMSPNAAKCYDLEVWLPGEGRYREISSCSNVTDYQARRGAIRFREAPKGKPKLLHTLNGSGVAIGRCAIAILEQHQLPDGSISVPEALRSYMGGRATLGTPQN